MVLRKVEGRWESGLDWVCQEAEFCASNMMTGCLGNFYLVGGRVEAELESCHWQRSNSDSYQQEKKGEKISFCDCGVALSLSYLRHGLRAALSDLCLYSVNAVYVHLGTLCFSLAVSC